MNINIIVQHLRKEKKFVVIWYNKSGDMMINYPNGKKMYDSKTKFQSRSNLGASLEDDLNKTNAYYRSHQIALIHKKPTPVQVVNVQYPKRSLAKITEAYYKTPSTTDYNGIYQGEAIDFEAKTTKNKTRIPLQLIHAHQIEHLRNVTYHGGHAYLIIRFSSHDETYLLEFERFDEYINKGDVRSIPYSWIKEHAYLCKQTYLKPCDYIEGIKLSLKHKGVVNNESK